MSEHLDCNLCGQIVGDSSKDLLAKALGYLKYQKSVLVDYDRFVVFPSLGALAVGHVLLCPKEHVPSIAAMNYEDRIELSNMASDLGAFLSRVLGVPVHKFEHGLALESQRIICSVSHAHLHLLPTDVAPSYVLGDNLWSQVEGGIANLAPVIGGLEYLLYVDPDGTSWVKLGGEGSFESQTMRKVFARAHGMGASWNWRDHPQKELVSKTIRLFNTDLEASAD